MTSATVRYDVANDITRIILDRPPVNALDLDMVRSVVAALQMAAAVRVTKRPIRRIPSALRQG